MRVIQTDSLKAGDLMGRSLYSESGNLLLSKGTVLTDGLIQRIKDSQIVCLYIDDALSKGLEPKGLIDDETMVRSVRTIKETLGELTKVGPNTKMAGTIPLKHYLAVETIIKDIMVALENNKDALYTVTELMGTDMYTYKHSINVAVLSILVAKSMGFNYETIKSIAMGGLLHDVGKVKVSPEILNKKDRLTVEEFEEMKKHPEYGYEMVREDRVLSAVTKNIIKFHHEKLDGSGYLNKLTKGHIPDYVSIISVCDMYDAMTTDRCYRRRMPIYSALEILMAETIYRIDQRVYRCLVDNICIYPVGSSVSLSDGRTAIIVEYRKENPTRPKVRIAEEPYMDMDLEIERTVFIVESIVEEMPMF